MVWVCFEFDEPPHGDGSYCQRRLQLFVCDDMSWPAGVEGAYRRDLIRSARDPIYQSGSFEEPEIGAIKGSEKIRVIDLLSPITRERRSSARCQHDQSGCRSRPRSDLGFFRSRGRETAAVCRPRDLADGEREAFRHGHGSWNNDPYLARHCR